MPLPTLLTASDNDLIRGAIRADISVSDLPDVIVAGAYSPAASQVVAFDPQATSWPPDSDQAQRVHDAAVYFAAAFLVAVLPQVSRESFLGYSYTLELPDPVQRADLLRSMAYGLLAENLAEDVVTALRPVVGTRAQGRRGDVSGDTWPEDWVLIGLGPPPL